MPKSGKLSGHLVQQKRKNKCFKKVIYHVEKNGNALTYDHPSALLLLSSSVIFCPLVNHVWQQLSK